MQSIKHADSVLTIYFPTFKAQVVSRRQQHEELRLVWYIIANNTHGVTSSFPTATTQQFGSTLYETEKKKFFFRRVVLYKIYF